MPGPNGTLTVRITDGYTDRHVTQHVRDLKFTKTAPGGHRDCSFRLTVPRGTFTDLGPQDRAYIYDARTTRCIFDSYIENPTPVDGPAGQSYDITARGGMALLNDETRPLIYIDTSLDTWDHVQYGTALKGSNASQFNDIPIGGATGMLAQFPEGLTVATGAVAAVDNYSLARANMEIAAVRVLTVSGKNDTGWRTELFDGTTVHSTGDPIQMSLTGADQTFWVPTLADTGVVILQLRRNGLATNVADDLTWTKFGVLSLLGRRVDRYGTLLGTAVEHGSTATSVLASQVVEDLLGRLLTFCDPATADVDVTTWPIDQLAMPDGVKAAQVLDALELWEPDHFFEILESDPAGLHRFNYRAWPTEPRYEVSVKDGWRQTGSDVDLCNRILVSWTDHAGTTQTTEVTAADLGLTGIGLPVDALGSRVKDADPITLPEGLGSEANALQIGGAILTEKINPPRAGTVVVRRPVLDRDTDSLVMPWELEPGCVVRIRETGDELRCTEVSYDDDSVASTLTLGRPVLTTEQRVARLSAA